MTTEPQDLPEQDVPEDDDNEHTIVVTRELPDDDLPELPDDDDNEHTVMVDRGSARPESADVEDDDEHTVIVDRGAARTESEEDDEHTVMVDRGTARTESADEDDDEHTVMVDRGAARAESDDDGDHTVVVSRKGRKRAESDDDDHTVVVDKAAAKSGAGAPTLSKPGKGGRRRGLTPPPVPMGFAPTAVEASGPGAQESYQPREIPEPPAPAPIIYGAPEATRESSLTMPSVRRHAATTGRVAVVVFVISCVASVVGLTLIALALF